MAEPFDLCWRSFVPNEQNGCQIGGIRERSWDVAPLRWFVQSCMIRDALHRCKVTQAAPVPGSHVFPGRVGSRRVAGFEWSRRFLDPPYHSVRRVFPRYGWKAGLSSGAFLNNRQLKPAPGVRRPIIQFASALRASRCRAGAPLSRSSPALCREADSMMHRLEELTPPPQRPSLGSGL